MDLPGKCGLISLLPMPAWGQYWQGIDMVFGTVLAQSWYGVGTNLGTKLGTNLVPTWEQLGSNLVPTWHQLGSNLVPTWWYQAWYQAWYQFGTTWH